MPNVLQNAFHKTFNYPFKQLNISTLNSFAPFLLPIDKPLSGTPMPFTIRPKHPNAVMLVHTVSTVVCSIISHDDILQGSTWTLPAPLSCNENLKPAQREMEAGGRAWLDSTSLMLPKLRAQNPLTAPCSTICEWDDAEWQGLWLCWHQSTEKQSESQ